MTIAQSWTDAETLADLETDELKQTLKDGPKVILLILQTAMRRNDLSMRNLSANQTNTYIDTIIKNITFELMRRLVAYDRTKLNHFAMLKVEDLIKTHEHPHQEFIRAYLMRHREQTGEELTEEGLKKAKFEVKY